MDEQTCLKCLPQTCEKTGRNGAATLEMLTPIIDLHVAKLLLNFSSFSLMDLCS
jgi:hypothetical protein